MKMVKTLARSLLLTASMTALAQSGGAEPIDIGSRLELLVDEYLIKEMRGGAELRVYYPTPAKW